MPTFPALNGQVKTPLRWYRTLLEQSRNTRQCRDADCDYAILSLNNAMPPFQLWVGTSVTAITSWRLYDMEDNLLEDVTSQAGLLTVVPFVNYNYLVYDGAAFTVPIPQENIYAVIVAGGQSYYSEVFRPLCPATVPNYVGQTGVITIGDDDIFSNDLNPDSPWSVTRYDFLLTGMYSGAGAPTDPSWEFEGSQAANLTTGDLYTYTDGAWVSGRPGGTDLDQWYNQDAGTWHTYDDPNWLSAAPPYGAAIAGGVLGFFGQAYQPIAIGRALDEIPCFGFWVEFNVSVLVTLGTFRLEVWDENGEVYAQSQQYGDTVSNGILYSYVGGPDWTFHIVAGEPDEPAVVDVYSIDTVCADDSLDCHLVLEWTNCGNVGNTYYEEGFEQQFILPSEAIIQTPEPTTTIEVEEDANQNRVETFRRTEVEYTVVLGYVPWHVLDALSQVPLHDTITLTQQRGLGTVPIKDLRIEHDWDGQYGECMALVTLKFQVDEAAVTGACCGQFDHPCLEVCFTAAGLESEETPYVEGEDYLMTDGTVAQVTVQDPLEFGSRRACPYRFARISTDTEVSYWYYRSGEWLPAAEFIAITPINCESIPATYTVTALTMPGYSVRLDYTDIDSGTWTPITDMLFTQGELLSGVQITPPIDAVSIRITLIGADECLFESSRSDALPCECLEFSFGFADEFGVTATVLGSGGIFVGAQIEPIEAQVQVDGTGPWIDIQQSISGGIYSISGAAEIIGATTYQYRVRSAWRTGCDWALSEVRTP